jgi:superfamily II DNA or RNA helicase
MNIGGRKVDFVHYREKPKAPQSKPKSHAVWRRRLAELRMEWIGSGDVPAAPWPAGKQIIYALEPNTDGESHEISIELYTRPSEKSKGLKQLRLAMGQINSLPDPVDRQLIGMLVGIADQEYAVNFNMSVPHELRFRNVRDSVMLLRTMCQTGRCVLLTGMGEDYVALEWEEGEPWRMELAISPDGGGKSYRLKGVLKRGEQRIDVTEPQWIARGGLVAMDGRIAELVDDGAFQFARLLRHEQNLEIPVEQGDQLLEELLDFPRVPALELPESMGVSQSRTAPRPRLTISHPKQRVGTEDRLVCKLTFDYESAAVEHADSRAAVFDPVRRKIVHRDLQAEQQALALLSELGLRINRSWDAEPHEFALIPRRLPGAVAALTARQWHVEVSGKVYRQPGKIQVRVSSGIDWFELQGEADFEGVGVKIPRLLQAIRKGETTIVLDDGTVGILPEEWLKRYGLLAAVGEVKEEAIQFGKNQVGLLDALLADVPLVSVDEAFAKARDQLRKFEGVRAVDPVASFIGTLRPYQCEGLGWLGFLRTFGLNGCLADDMGLGKTVQVLALLEERRTLRAGSGGNGNSKIGPSLVVVPRSLVFNWQQEAAKFTPNLRVLNHATVDRLKTPDHFHEYDLVLTTYGTLRNDVAAWRDIRFDYVILDEAQAIKNAASESAKAARLLRADYRLALSGTPVQNHLGELWSLLEFLNPGMLGASKAFSAMVAGADRAASVETRQFLANALRPFILRRTKEQVARDLPEKFEQTIFCELDKPQRALYDELKEHFRQSLLTKIEQDGLGKSKLQVLEALLRLRQAACHPGLLSKTRLDDASAKLDTLLPRLAEVAEEGHKSIVFSQFTSFLAIVRKKLDEQGVVYEYLDGKTRDRQQHVERFQTDANCKLFLISLKAGGLGLNLTAAQYVFLLDPWWNPAVEAQAIDRAHRIGQTSQVFAYRLIARDTVEEKVLQLQQSKRDLADAIINADNALISRLGREDLELLLS